MGSYALLDFGKALSNSPIPSRGLHSGVSLRSVGIGVGLTVFLATSLLFASAAFAFPVTFATSFRIFVSARFTFSSGFLIVFVSVKSISASVVFRLGAYCGVDGGGSSRVSMVVFTLHISGWIAVVGLRSFFRF